MVVERSLYQEDGLLGLYNDRVCLWVIRRQKNSLAPLGHSQANLDVEHFIPTTNLLGHRGLPIFYGYYKDCILVFKPEK